MQAAALSLLALLAFSSVNSQVPLSSWTPKFYQILLNVTDMQTSNNFNGNVTINMTITKETNIINMNVGHEMNVTNIKVMTMDWNDNWNAEKIKGFTKENSTLTIEFEEALDKVDHVMTMEFSGRYQSTMGGLTKLNISGRYLGIASPGPNSAGEMFPCNNNPRFRAKMSIDVIAQNKMEVVMLLPPDETVSINETSKRIRFSNLPPMAVHQLGFLILNEEILTSRNVNTTSGDLVEITTRALYHFGIQTQWGTELVSQMVDAMKSFTNQPFPLSKLEQTVLPDVTSHLYQSWGIINYSEEDFLVLANLTSSRDKQRVALTLAERVVAQYFGGLMSTDWQDSWLMQGMSEYLKYLIADSVPEMSSWELPEQMVVEMIQPALALNSSKQALTLMETTESAQILAAYSDLNKKKGAAVLCMVHHIMGDNLFREVIGYFIRSNNNKVVDPSMLWDTMYRAARGKVDLAGKSMLQVMEAWVTTPGQPTLSVTRNETHFTISQDSNHYVPVTYCMQSNPQIVHKFWLLPGNSFSVSASGNDWILVNINQTSFCPVYYTNNLWPVMSRQVKTNPNLFSQNTRAQLMDDMFTHWINGDVLTDTWLDYMGCYETETKYMPWYTLLRNVKNVMNKFINFPSYFLLQSYILNLMGKVISDVGMEPTPKDTHIDKLRRSLILENACLFGHHKCQEKASYLVASWLNGTYYDADLSTALLCAGVANMSSDAWYRLHSMYITSMVPSIQAHLLPALTCSRDTQLLNQFIANITLKSLYSQKEKHILLKALASTPFGSSTLFNWLLDSLYAKLNRTRNETEENPTAEPSTESSSTPNPENTTSKVAREAADRPVGEQDTEHVQKISDVDTILILSYLSPSMTHLYNGTELELVKNYPGWNEEVVEAMERTINQTYKQHEWARKRNGEIQIWLEKAQEPTTPTTSRPTGVVTDAPPTTTPSSSAPLIANLCMCLVTLAMLLRHFS